MSDNSVKITCNARLLMEPEDLGRLRSLLEAARHAYNACAAFIEENCVPLDVKSVHDAVYGWMRSEHPLLPSQTVIKVYKDVAAAFRSIRSNRHKDARTPEKKNLSMRLDKRLYSRLGPDGISLTGLVPNRRKAVASSWACSLRSRWWMLSCRVVNRRCQA